LFFFESLAASRSVTFFQKVPVRVTSRPRWTDASQPHAEHKWPPADRQRWVWAGAVSPQDGC